MTTQKQRITMHYFEDLAEALGDATHLDLPEEDTAIQVHQGRAKNIVIRHGNRIVDLSEGPDGEMMDGFEIIEKYPPHDDERDIITEMRPFPQTENDIRFLSKLATSIREQKENTEA